MLDVLDQPGRLTLLVIPTSDKVVLTDCLFELFVVCSYTTTTTTTTRLWYVVMRLARAGLSRRCGRLCCMAQRNPCVIIISSDGETRET